MLWLSQKAHYRKLKTKKLLFLELIVTCSVDNEKLLTFFVNISIVDVISITLAFSEISCH